MKKNEIFLLSGIVWLCLLGIFYTIKINVDSGSNYLTQDSILGIIIFHNVWIFVSYVVIGLGLIFLGIKKK